MNWETGRPSCSPDPSSLHSPVLHGWLRLHLLFYFFWSVSLEIRSEASIGSCKSLMSGDQHIIKTKQNEAESVSGRVLWLWESFISGTRI